MKSVKIQIGLSLAILMVYAFILGMSSDSNPESSAENVNSNATPRLEDKTEVDNEAKPKISSKDQIPVNKLDRIQTGLIGTVKDFHIGGQLTMSGEIIDYAESPLKDSIKSKITVIATDKFKYQNVRIEQIYEVDEDSNEELLITRAMVADHVIVKVKDHVNQNELQEVVDNHGLKIRKKMYSENTYLVETPTADVNSVYEALARLMPEEKVKHSDPDHIIYLSATPDDNRFSQLWAMNNTGQTGGKSDADIDAVEAWNLSKGSRNVVVGVIDTGVDYNHPDLKANMWTNPNEIPNNNKDDDGNGLVDDYYGYDFADGDSDPMDYHNHGTHCAGTIGGTGNNGVGVAGVNWKVRIMAIKFFGLLGGATDSVAVDCINYATDMGANLTSNSWGGYGSSRVMKEAIERAASKDILFIAAASNDTINNDIFPAYPASYKVANIISVAATDKDDNIAGFSNFGPNSVHIGAPGVEILSTIRGGRYAHFNGTSMACPHVAGVCALLKAYKPELDASEIKDLVINSGDPIPALDGKTITGKRLNAYNALKESDANIKIPAVLLSPSNNSILTEQNTKFTWSSAGGEGRNAYYYFLGTSPFDNDIASGATGRTSAVLPTSSKHPKIYLTLFTLIDGRWHWNREQYSFTTIQDPGVLLSPDNNSLIDGPTTFTWTGGSEVSYYYYYFGTAKGKNDIDHGFRFGTSVEKDFSGYSGPLHLRLWTLINNKWQFKDYEFRSK